MNTPLVKPLSGTNNPELQELITFFDETLGFCPNSILTMQIRPEIATAFINLNKAVMENHGRLTSALKRLIAYMASYTAGCRYCQAHAIRAAERYKGKPKQLENIWDYKAHPAFNDAERAALDFAVAASGIPNAVNDSISEELHKYWNDGEIVEMLGVISLFGYLNRWNDSMGTEMEQAAAESGNKFLAKKGWDEGKHRYGPGK
ncbi:MAG: carboxymuconolactone decarboxylase family protein [Bacteroidales bacterium]|nr:carboxymuconolactone decarboxylase family protein [Bacteroidales bacterium]